MLNDSHINWFKLYISAIILCALIQIVAIDSSFDNQYCSFLLGFATIVSALYIKQLDSFMYPNSTMILLGFNIGLCTIPLLAKTATVSSLVDGLNEPDLTFELTASLTILTVLLHFIYTKSVLGLPLRRLVHSHLKRNINITNSTPIPFLISLMIVSFILTKPYIEPTIFKLAQPFFQFIYLPLAISLHFLMVRILGNINPYLWHRTFLWLIISLCISFLLSLSTNSRSALLQPLVIWLSISLLLITTRSINSKNSLICFSFVIILLSFPFIHAISNSILYTRAYRSVISNSELVSLNLTIIGKRLDTTIHGNESSIWWSEKYLPHEFLNRISPIKMLDNSITISQRVSDSHLRIYKQFQYLRFVSILPSPLPSIFGVSSDRKVSLNRYTSADILSGFISRQTESRMLLGNLLSDLYILFGWLYPLYYGCSLLLIYILADLLSVVVKSTGFYVPSVIGVIMAPKHLLLFLNPSFVDIFVGYSRSFLESMVAYIIIVALAQKLLQLKQPL